MCADVAFFFGLGLGFTVVPGGSFATLVVPAIFGFVMGGTTVAILGMGTDQKKRAGTGGEECEEEDKEEIERIEKEEITDRAGEGDDGEGKDKVVEVIEMKEMIKE